MRQKGRGGRSRGREDKGGKASARVRKFSFCFEQQPSDARGEGDHSMMGNSLKNFTSPNGKMTGGVGSWGKGVGRWRGWGWLCRIEGNSHHGGKKINVYKAVNSQEL